MSALVNVNVNVNIWPSTTIIQTHRNRISLLMLPLNSRSHFNIHRLRNRIASNGSRRSSGSGSTLSFDVKSADAESDNKDEVDVGRG
jgi:hypothetical protein